MPKKVRELKALLSKAGFHMRHGKGSHSVWFHPKIKEVGVTLCGNDGDNAKPYLEKKVKKAIKKAGDL